MVKWTMADARDESPTERLRVAFELIDIADRMFRQRLRRESPDMSEEDIEQRVAALYMRRPGAEFGDGEGIRRGAESCRARASVASVGSYLAPRFS